MQDPSYGVPPSLLPHLACISTFRYPLAQRINVEQVFEYLLSAPGIVKGIQPMRWEYLTYPQDGSMFLSWMSPARQPQFPSDGYVWADPESSFTHELRGYTMEIWFHRSGFRPGGEQATAHQRYRYRLVAKSNPSAPGHPPDPSLWIVHYSPSEAQFRFPVHNIPISPQTNSVLQTRRFIESQGQLIRKDFMLSDRANWPQVQIQHQMPMGPGGMQPYQQAHMQQMAAARPGYYPQAQQGMPQPPPKRQRREQGPTPMAPVPGAHPAAPIAPDLVVLEEDTEFGDYLDNITPRELSLMRYKQHHEWMEEVFGSPYATGKILPIELGLGLAGDLEQITKGIFNPPNYENFADPQKRASAVKAYRKLKPEEAEEFEARVAKYMSDGQDEIEQMKKQHAQKLADFNKSRKWAQAERVLREAHGFEPGAKRSDTAVTTVEEIVKDVEATFGIKVKSQNDMTCVEKGGMLEKEEPKPSRTTSIGAQNGAVNGMQNGHMGGNPQAIAGANNMHAPTPPVNRSAAGTPIAGQTNQGPSAAQQAQSLLQIPDDGGMSLLDVDGMDLDIDMSVLPDDKSGEADWMLANQSSTNTPTAGNGTPAGEAAQKASDAAQTPAATSAGTPAGGAATSTTTPAAAVAAAAAGTADSGSAADQPASATAQSTSTPGIFDSPQFDSFDNLDTAGDALADYGAGDDLDLGLDNSAFGEAFQGTEGH